MSFKCYHQLEHSDCGLTCIRMVARHWGLRVPLRHLREISDVSRLGMSLRDITSTLKKLHLDSAPVKILPADLERMPLPAILYWRQRHFVVLYKVDARRRRYHIADPAQGKACYWEEEFLPCWLHGGAERGLAIVAEPADDFEVCQFPRENRLRNFLAYIGSYLSSHRRSFLWVMLTALVLMGADFMVPLMLRRTVDEGIGLRDVGLVMTLLLAQLSIMTGSLAASSGMDLLLTKVGLKINIDMVTRFLTRLTRFPLSFFDRKVSSDFIQKVSDQSRIKDFLVTVPNTLLVTLLNLVVFSALLCHYSPLIFGVFIALSSLEILWSAMFVNRRKTLNFATFINSSDNHNHAYELTNGMPELKINNAEQTYLDKWRKTQQRLNDISLRSSRLNLLDSGGQSVISRIKELAVTGIAAAMVIEGDMTLGIMMTLGYITGRLAQPFTTISASVKSVQDALLSYERIEEVLEDDSSLRGTEPYTAPTMEFRNVWFKYPGGSSPFVIQDFSLIIPAGKVTALVGESGCGKSTLIKLMLGFYEPQRGVLTLSGTPVESLDSSDWLRHCGVVMQAGQIFTCSILENIALSDSEPDTVKVWKMLETVGLRKFVETLPMGLSTRLGVSGIELSGGQKQRLMIARALYKDPDILFLDEATSSLDANNERTVTENIMEMRQGKTLIVAAHRLSTVRHADQIIFIKEGRIAETGTHDFLVSQKGEYWNLVKNQLQLSIA